MAVAVVVIGIPTHRGRLQQLGEVHQGCCDVHVVEVPALLLHQDFQLQPRLRALDAFGDQRRASTQGLD